MATQSRKRSPQSAMADGTLPELFLGVKRGTFRRDDPHAEMSAKAFSAIRDQIVKRDDYTCQYCDFRSLKFQEAHHVNDDHRNNDPSNLITACPLCHQVNHIWHAGHQRSGTIVYIPELSQIDLNNLARTLWLAQLSSDMHIKKYADMLEQNIRSNGQAAARQILGSFDACQLGEIMQQMDPRLYLARTKRMKGFHLMALKQPFSRQIQYWHQAVYKGLEPDNWVELTEKWINKYS